MAEFSGAAGACCARDCSGEAGAVTTNEAGGGAQILIELSWISPVLPPDLLDFSIRL